MSSITNLSPQNIHLNNVGLKASSDTLLSEISSHFERVNYFLRFIEKNESDLNAPSNSQKLGMISYEEIARGLEGELGYFTEKASDASLNFHQKVITTQAQKLLEYFIKIFNPFRALSETIANNKLTEEDLKNPANQIMLYLMPIIMSNAKNLTLLHSIFIQSLFLLNPQDQNEILLIDEKLINMTHYFDSTTHAILNLEQPQILASLNDEAAEEYFIDFFSQIENFESMFAIAFKNVTSKDLSNESFTTDLLTLSTKLKQVKFSIEKMIDERVQNEQVSSQTIENVAIDYQNFFKEIKAPRAISQ